MNELIDEICVFGRIGLLNIFILLKIHEAPGWEFSSKYFVNKRVFLAITACLDNLL